MHLEDLFIEARAFKPSDQQKCREIVETFLNFLQRAEQGEEMVIGTYRIQKMSRTMYDLHLQEDNLATRLKHASNYKT